MARKIIATKKTAADAVSDKSSKVEEYSRIAREQAMLSDMAGFRTTLAAATDIAHSIADARERESAYFTIAYAYIGLSTEGLMCEPCYSLPPHDMIDIPGAKTTALLLINSVGQSWIYQRIVKAQVSIADMNGASETANLVTEADDKAISYLDLAEALMNSGDMDGARETLTMAKNAAKDIPEDTAFIESDATKLNAYCRIATAMARAGDVAGAIAIAELVPDTERKAYVNCDIARAQANAGDLAGAMKSLDTAKITADAMTDASDKTTLYNIIMPMRAKASDVPSAETWAASMPTLNDRINAYIAIARVLTGN